MKKNFQAVMIRQLVVGAAACFLVFHPVGVSEAMPAVSSGTSAAFAKADKNQDGLIDHDEFAEGFPDIQDQAFHIIDADNTNTITPEEWDNFMKGHSAETAEHNAKAGMTGSSTEPLPLLPPDK